MVGLLLLVGAFGLFELGLWRGRGIEAARTCAVNVFVFGELFYLFNCRSLTRPFWQLGIFSNRWLWGGLAAMAILQLLLTYWPPLNAVFQTAPISLAAWGEIVAFALFCSLIIGLDKYWTAFHVKRATQSA